jgi:hypothetical protein
MCDELPGRSRLRSTMTRNRYITVHVTPDERALLAAAAETSSMSASSWVRHHALRAAGVAPAPGSLQAPPAGRSPRKVERLIRGRFTTAEHEAIVEHARACGLTVSALIRRLVLGSAPMTRRPLLRSAIVAVHRAGDNLGQLLRLAGSGSPLAPDLVGTITQLRSEIHALRDALLRADAAGAADPGE